MIKLFDKDMNEIKINNTEYQIDVFPLDNFSAFGLIMDGKYFQTSEHAFQYLKFIDNNEELANKIRESFSPNDARKIAHENNKYKVSNWQDIKYDNMYKVLKLKVVQNPVVKNKLLKTNDYIISEYCTDEDTDWGLDNNNQGNNHLGKIWMKIREELRNRCEDKNDKR